LKRASLIFSISDDNWITWYIFTEGDLIAGSAEPFSDAMSREGRTLDYDHTFGWSKGAWAFNPSKPRTVRGFMVGPEKSPYDIYARATVLVQKLSPKHLKVGMTIHLSDGVENLTWPSIETHPGAHPKPHSHFWGYIVPGSTEDRGVGLSRGFTRFRNPSKHRPQLP
jgi:hypothetical protein